MSKKEKQQEQPETEETELTVENKTETPPEAAPEVPKAPEVNWEEKYKAEHDTYLRLAAEFDNFRKRTAKEKDQSYGNGKADAIAKLLPIYDNLERAAAAEGGEDSPHKKGLEMIFQQFRELLDKQGVKEIETKGKTFDPETMNAVMHIDDETLGENEVAQVFQAGFELNGKVLRHAIVQVAN